jgi:hypothetical protein
VTPQFEAAVLGLLTQGLGNLAQLVALNSAAATGATAAFGRPQPTVVMGPNPLPVTVVGGAAGGFAPAPAQPAGAVSAFDRPQSVIIVGPNPLPVTIVGGAAPNVTAGPRPAARERQQPTGPSPLERASSMLAYHFRGILGPLAALTTFLAPTVSGFGVFQGALRVFATAVAPILLPAFVLLSVALLEMSDVIWDELKPVLVDFYQFMLETGLPVIKEFIGALRDAASWVNENITKPTTKGLGDIYDDVHAGGDGTGSGGGALPVGEFLRSVMKQMKPAEWGGGEDFDGEWGGGGDFDGEAKGKGSGKAIGGKALDDVLKELTLSTGAKSTFMGLGNVNQAAAQAAANFSPFEARMLQMTREAVTAMQEAARNTRQGPKPTYDEKR